MKKLKEKIYRGSAIRDALEGFAALRIAIFRDFPYLYEGSIDYERGYIQSYSRSPHALLFALYNEEGALVGASTALPLAQEDAHIQQPFIEAGLQVNEYLYFGESLLLPSYRGQGYGHRFFDIREAHARSLGLPKCCFCSVERSEQHPLRPKAYRPLHAFWRKRGYTPSELFCSMSWKDSDKKEKDSKQLRFWMREL